MFISQIKLKPDAGSKRAFWKLVQDSYDVHSLIWDLYSDAPDRKRDFLYRLEMKETQPSFITVSSREPENRFGVWDIKNKEYNPRISPGQDFCFLLRANPIVAKLDESGKQHRHDVIMNAKKNFFAEKGNSIYFPMQSAFVQQAGYEWLFSRSMPNGFQISKKSVKTDGYFQHIIRKPKFKRPIKFSTVEFSGILTVTDPEQFINMLYSGIGPAKGFGCGLMLIRPLYSD